MRGLAVFFVVIAACAKGGAEIVVDPAGIAIDRVVLFTGTGDSHGDPIAPAGYAQPLGPNTWWQRDPYNVLDHAAVASGHAVTFAFTPGASGDIPIVVAVGFAGDKPLGVAVKGPIVVSPDYVSQYTVALEPFTDPMQPDNAIAMRLQLWQSPMATDPAATCVHVEDRRQQKLAMIISDPSDPDCDGLATGDPLECQPQVFRGQINAPLDKVSCALPETNATVAACVLGGPPCTDGRGFEAGACVHTNYCVPKSACDACTNAGQPYACLTDASTITTANGFSHLECTMQVDMLGQLCTGVHTAFAQPPFTMPPSCIGKPQILRGAGMGADDQTTFSGPGGALQVKLTNLTPACSFEIEASGVWPIGDHRIGFLAVGNLTNGRGAAIPVILNYDPTPSVCDNVTCAYIVASLGDGLNECLHAPTY